MTLFGPVVILTRAEDAAALLSRKEIVAGWKLAWPLTRIWIALIVLRPINSPKKYFASLHTACSGPSYVRFDLFDVALICLDQRRWEKTKACTAHPNWKVPGGDRYFNSSTAVEMRYKRT